VRNNELCVDEIFVRRVALSMERRLRIGWFDWSSDSYDMRQARERAWRIARWLHSRRQEPQQLKLNAPACEARLIEMIVDRVIKGGIIPSDQRLKYEMDVTVCHLNCTPLNLAAMAVGRVSDVCHDLGGIREHLCRRAGTLDGCFQPRFAVVGQRSEM
jgi:hypothetical protein